MQDIQATQSPPVGGKENKNKGVPSSMRGGFPTQNEDPPTVFNTGVRTFAKKQMSEARVRIQEFHFVLIHKPKECRVLSHCRTNMV